jgi:hypothetical protein
VILLIGKRREEEKKKRLAGRRKKMKLSSYVGVLSGARKTTAAGVHALNGITLLGLGKGSSLVAAVNSGGGGLGRRERC